MVQSEHLSDRGEDVRQARTEARDMRQHEGLAGQILFLRTPRDDSPERSRRMKTRVTMTAVVLMAMAGNSLAADWPQYLGPDRNSISSEKGLMRSWPEGGPEVLWSVGVGRGFISRDVSW